MKMNYERNYIHISRIVRHIAFLVILMSTVLFSAEWKVEEAPSVFTYKWEMSQEEINDFVKTGQIKSGISGSVNFNGRQYPVYTIMLENAPEDLTYIINNKTIAELSVSSLDVASDNTLDYRTGQIPLSSSYLELSPEERIINNREYTAQVTKDNIDPGIISDFITFNKLPGMGTLIEIIPIIPASEAGIRLLTSAEIKLVSTNSQKLQKSSLKKEKSQIAKTSSLKTELPDEFCALYIEEPGVFQISGQDLFDRGVDIRTINPDNLKLYWWGEEIPCRVTSTYELDQETFQYHDLVQFYIPEKKNPYGSYKYNPFSDYDVVYLFWDDGNGLRYVQENSEINTSISSEDKFTPDRNRTFRSTIHIEKNQNYQNLSRLHEDELSHKYEHSFYSPAIRIGRSVSFPFELWDPVLDSPYNVDFTLRMQGLTYSVDDEMDHQILVSVNNQYLLEDEWDGQLPKISTNYDMQYNHENLIHGENEIEISVKGFESNPYLDDQVLYDWLEISYDRYMIVHNNRLKFSPQHGPGTYMFEIQGLTSASNVLILKNGTNWIRGYYVEQDVSSQGEISYSIYFEDQCDGTEFYQVAGNGVEGVKEFGIESLDSIRYVNTLEDEHYNYHSQGDYVIVTHKDFYHKAQDLADHKESIGFTPVVYELERIYDEYNYGNESPYAIKNFLTDIYLSWSTNPKYVLLIGDTGTDNPLPIIKYQSTGAIGAVIADNWFADIDDDFVLEMALGRLPISLEQELDSIISKIRVFDSMLISKQKNRTALISGPESTFKTQIQNYINTVSPDQVQADRLYLYDSHITGDFDAGIYATDSLVSIINNGVFAINYIGHGGGYTWDNYVLPYEAFNRFKPERPFIVNSMTCYTNTFSNDNALGEMFIRHPRGGVSVLSSTGYGWVNSNYYIFEKLSEHMFQDGMSHGEALRFALTDYFFSTFGRNANFIDQVDGQILYKYFRKTLFYQSCLLGDPSATFPKVPKGSPTISSNSLTSGQNITITIPEADVIKGVVDLVGTKGQGRKFPIKQKIPLSFEQGQSNFNVPELPDNIYDGFLQLSYWNDQRATYATAIPVSMDSPYIEELIYYPDQPGIMDSAVVIRIKLESISEIDSINLRVYHSRDLNENYNILPMEYLGENIYQSKSPIIYSSKHSFFTVLSDSITSSAYYSGTYFMPEIYLHNDTITADYYYLAPEFEVEKDISIFDYSIENGQSKLVLLNETDSSIFVKIDMEVIAGDLTYSMSDTALIHYDVDAQYEAGYEKINTLYYDFLPALGNSNLRVEISPISFNDLDTSNNYMSLNINNKWLNVQNDHFINHNRDTAKIASLINTLYPSENASFSGSVYVNEYERSYSLSNFGALQSQQKILYVNSSDEEIHLRGSMPTASLSEGEFIAYLSLDLNEFYRVPETRNDTISIFPIHKAGYYLLATSIDNQDPEIELNINARALLTRGYVSERSDFSVIMSDDHGINPLEYYWSVLFDGEEISEENILVIEEDNVEQFKLNFKLDMEMGEHTLQVVTHDLVGNRNETEIYDIIYTGESQLIDYGTFPNPFSAYTTFIYELTEQFDDVRIKIFTLSGQKILTMSVSENAITDLPLYSIGYHEAPWYGKDEFGNTVANGVYFYVIEGEVNGKKIKSTGKIAKLRNG